MFDFADDDEPDPTFRHAIVRYFARKRTFRGDGLPLPNLRHQALWLLHNCVAHPALGFAPNRTTVALHQITSAWLNHAPYVHREVPYIEDRFAWKIHNVVAHTIIGVFPRPHTFAWHDETAEALGVKGWV